MKHRTSLALTARLLALTLLSATVAVIGAAEARRRLATGLAAGPGPDFADLVTGGCGLAVLVAGAALASAAASLAVRTLRGDRLAPQRGLRRLALVLCGSALGSALALGPAHAATAPVPPPQPTQPTQPTQPPARTTLPADALVGLVPPDRTVDDPGAPRVPDPARAAPTPAVPPAPARPPAPPSSPTLRVAPGDSLWSIAAAALGAGATSSEVADYWLRLQRLNDAALAGHPDLIHPGLELRLPPIPHHQEAP